MTDSTAFLPATELLKLYRAKKLSPVAVVEETLHRLETYEAALNAFVLYDPETALAGARASEARWHKGEPQGLLDGVPVAIKDTQLTRGWPRLVGSKTIDPNQRWHEDAPATARLRSEDDPRIWLEADNRLAALRGHAEPVEPRTHPGWFERRQRGGGSRRHLPPGDRYRCRRLHPHPSRF
jgi:aspartyl-tRNA(Asn)/glutamyl-tRNA(Gln) amidotransferase subunit A